MKKIFFQTLLCVLFFIPITHYKVAAQASEKIHHLEYFFDTDPGFGNATSIAIPTPAILLNNFNFTPNISSLSNGLHTLNVRTIDSLYRWSLTKTQLFYKEQLISNTVPNITAAEYFFDTDPGFGNATTASVTTSSTVTFTFAGSISSLTNGLHNLFVRTKDINGKWSLSAPQLFYKQAAAVNSIPNITNAEYFFDTDPGFGNATAAGVSAGSMVTFTFAGNISSLTNGLHNLFVRTKDANGNWSISSPQLFYKQAVIANAIPNITAAEYFFDTDPGFGNATSISITAAQTITFGIGGTITALTNGLHNLFVRTKDAYGNWSITTAQTFYKQTAISNAIPNITAAEYFFDNDPGFGNATAASVSAGTTVTFAITGNIALLTNGLHYLHVRTKDANGKWSLTTAQLFYKEAALNNPIPNITAAEYFFDTDPGFGNAIAASVTAGTTVTFTFAGNIALLTNGLHYLYVRTKDVNGKWSLTTAQLFYKEPAINNPIPNIVAAEYYVDSDPGFGNATPFSVSPQGQTIVQNVNFSASSLARGLHRLYIRVKDANGKWSLTATHLFYYENALPVHPTDQFVKLEWFWNTDPGFGNANAVTIPSGNNGQITNFAFNVPVPGTFSNTKQNFFVRVLDDWSLTTVRVVDFTGISLPVTLLEFTAKAQQNDVLLLWNTAQENNSDYFDVERSIDGVHFEKIGKVNAAGNSNTITNYNLTDYKPNAGINFYRLKQVDKNGRQEYSPIIKIVFLKSGDITSYPNPVVDKLNVIVSQTILQNNKLRLQLFDSKGALIIENNISNINTVVPFIMLAKGSYVLVVKNESNATIYSSTVIKR